MNEQSKEVKGHCPLCNSERNALIVASFETHWSDADSPVEDSNEYRILKCKGCDTPYFQEYFTCSEEVDYSYDREGNTNVTYIPTIKYWPSPIKRDRPNWLTDISVTDSVLYNLLSEVYTALDNDLNVLAAIGIRTAFDRASELLKIDTNLSFNDKLKELLNRSSIGQTEKEALDTLTDAGNAAAHRAWKPTIKELDTLMFIIEQFIYYRFLLNDEIKPLRSKIPQRPKKKK